MIQQMQAPITRYTVFVPGSFPQHSYVRRKFRHRRTLEEIDPEEQILDALNQKGIIAQVVGPSKSGKTRAIENCVGESQLVTVAGVQITRDQTLWDIVIRKIKAPISSESTSSNESSWGSEASVTSSTGIPLASLEAEIASNLGYSKEAGETVNFENDPFLAAIHALKTQEKVLFLDDFHTIPSEIQPFVAAQLKAAAQFGIKICLAEVPHHSDSTISALPDLTGRVQKIEFQYWTQDDLKQIPKVGFDKLNVSLAPGALDAFAMEAAGSPQLMQMICLNAAGYAKINGRLNNPLYLQLSMDNLRSVLLKTHELIDRENILKILDNGPDERGNSRNRYPILVLGSGDNYEISLAAISLNPPVSTLTWSSGHDNILRRIDRVCADQNNKPQKGQITRAFEQMQSLAEKHMPLQPILEWDSSTGLHVLDPYFLFYLRWSEKYERIRGEFAES